MKNLNFEDSENMVFKVLYHINYVITVGTLCLLGMPWNYCHRNICADQAHQKILLGRSI